MMLAASDKIVQILSSTDPVVRPHGLSRVWLGPFFFT